MSISSHFQLLRAPLKNTRWSWGAMRQDGSCVLRINRDECKAGEALLWSNSWHDGLGAAERKQHLASCKNFYCVLCSIAPNTDKERITSWDKREVFFGTTLRTDAEGNTWLKLLHRVPVGELIS